MKGLVISGGGAWGAYGGGTIAALNKDYDIVSGSSTGALIAPFAALKNYDALKEGYTSVTQKNIFSVNPFNKKGHISIWNAVWRLIRGKRSLGESHNLRKLIDKFVTIEDYVKLIESKKEVIVACQQTDVYPGLIHHKSSLQEEFEAFKDYMWASSNFPLVMSILQKDGKEWADGGTTEILSTKKVIEMGAKEVDVIIHKTRTFYSKKNSIQNMRHHAMRIFNILLQEIRINDIDDGIDAAKIHGAKLNIYWMHRSLSDNALMFDKQEMKQWWDEGFNSAFDESRIDRYDFSENCEKEKPTKKK